MGEYTYRVTAKTVRLENGQMANVAIFSHKTGLRGSHERDMVDAAKLTGWVTLGGSKGGVHGQMGYPAIRFDGQRLTDYGFDRIIERGAETSKVVAPGTASVHECEDVILSRGEGPKGFTTCKTGVTRVHKTTPGGRRTLIAEYPFTTFS